jgi:hypothetical protein
VTALKRPRVAGDNGGSGAVEKGETAVRRHGKEMPVRVKSDLVRLLRNREGTADTLIDETAMAVARESHNPSPADGCGYVKGAVPEVRGTISWNGKHSLLRTVPCARRALLIDCEAVLPFVWRAQAAP